MAQVCMPPGDTELQSVSPPTRSSGVASVFPARPSTSAQLSLPQQYKLPSSLMAQARPKSAASELQFVSSSIGYVGGAVRSKTPNSPLQQESAPVSAIAQAMVSPSAAARMPRASD